VLLLFVLSKKLHELWSPEKSNLKKGGRRREKREIIALFQGYFAMHTHTGSEMIIRQGPGESRRANEKQQNLRGEFISTQSTKKLRSAN
jgi:hypothetical protein